MTPAKPGTNSKLGLLITQLIEGSPILPLTLIVSLAIIITTFQTLVDHESVSTLEFILDTFEQALVITGAGGVFVLLHKLRKEGQERTGLAQELEIARVEGSQWRKQVQSFTNGLGAEIDRQFVRWSLSSAEEEVARLTIKGLSHKEIANLRGTSEATVRQQARAIYQKSGLPGKAAFSAYFLEDLLPPNTTQQ